MKTNVWKMIWAVPVLCSGMLFLVSCGGEPAAEKEDDYNKVAVDSLCVADPSWFPHASTPAPKEGANSPFAASGTSNQIFHQWSWQKFLWLTKPKSSVDVTPLFLDQSRVYQVSASMDRIAQSRKANVVILSSYDVQAGGEQAVLKTNPAYNPSVNEAQTVYYSLHMNPIMYTAAQGFAAAIKSGALNPDNEEVFPVGSFELKVSWVSVDAIPDSKKENYYVTKAAFVDVTTQDTTFQDMAMLGMHVVGVVENHPEFIWATFEHDDMSPNFDWKTKRASSAKEKLLFAKGSVSGLRGIRFDTALGRAMKANSAYDLFQFGIPLQPGGAFMSTSQEEPENFNNIVNINACVKAKLDDVWNNYFYNGSIWLNMDGTSPAEQARIIDSLGYNIGKVTPKSLVRGSANCANVTMETFTQTFQDTLPAINVNTIANCFSCHSGSNYISKQLTNTSPLYMSHVFRSYLGKVQGKSEQEVEATKKEGEMKDLLRFRKK